MNTIILSEYEPEMSQPVKLEGTLTGIHVIFRGFPTRMVYLKHDI